MIVKMIQNLENKIELQINSLETRIEKMQGPPNTRPPLPMNQPGGGAGGRQKESASDDLFTCVFLEEQNGLF